MTLPPAPTLRARIGAVWGAEYAESLLPVHDSHNGTTVAGLVERPSDVGTRTRRIHIAVNGRTIRDAGLVRAAEAAYRSTIPAGLRPSLMLELTIPADAVDVNVHPAKAEVRFRERWPTERAVEGAVRRALGVLSSAAAVGPRIWNGGAAGAVFGGPAYRSWPVERRSPGRGRRIQRRLRRAQCRQRRRCRDPARACRARRSAVRSGSRRGRRGRRGHVAGGGGRPRFRCPRSSSFAGRI